MKMRIVLFVSLLFAATLQATDLEVQYDRPGSSSSESSGIAGTNRTDQAIDKRLYESAINMHNSASKLDKKASRYRMIGYALLPASGAGYYWLRKSRKYKKEARKMRSAANQLIGTSAEINDAGGKVDIDGEQAENSDWMNVNDLPDNAQSEIPSDIVDNEGNFSENDFLDYLEKEEGVSVEEDADDLVVTHNGETIDKSDEMALTTQAMSNLTEEQKRAILSLNEQDSEQKKFEEKPGKMSIAQPQSKPVNQNQLFQQFVNNENRKRQQRRPTATAKGKVVLYNGEPIGHKFDNLFEMIHRAYDKATEDGLFYPPNTRLNPDGTPRTK